MSDQDVAVLISLHGQCNEKVGHAEEEGHHAPEEQGVEGRQRIPLFIVAVAAAPSQKQAEQKILLLVHLVPYAVLFPIVILTNEARALLLFEIDAGFQLGILQRQLRLDKVIPGQLLAGMFPAAILPGC